MIPPAHFLEHVIRPVLSGLAKVDERLGGTAAEQLMLGTAIAESRLEAFEQKGGGPARSFFQIEASGDPAKPLTFEDIYDRYLRGRPGLLIAVQRWLFPDIPAFKQLPGNQHFACAIARMKFWPVKSPLPQAGDFDSMGRYYKRWYNTGGGAGSAAHWVHLFKKYVKE